MVELDATAALVIANTSIQLAAAFFSFKVYEYNKNNKAWLFLTLAFLVMAVRRVLVSSNELGAFIILEETFDFYSRGILPLLISVFLLWGMYSFYKNFKTQEVIFTEKKKEFLAEFEQNRAAKRRQLTRS